MTGAAMFMTSGGAIGLLAGGTISGSDGVAHFVSFSWNNDGSLTIVQGVTPSNSAWVAPATAGVAALYQIFFHTSSGALSVGSETQDTWLDLSSSRTIQKSVAGNVSGTYSIREKATTVVRVNAASWSMVVT